MNKIIKDVSVIPSEAQINIVVGGGLYIRLHQLLMDFATQKDPKEWAQDLTTIKEKGAETKYQYNVETLLSLIVEIENKAKEQNQIQLKDIELSNSH